MEVNSFVQLSFFSRSLFVALRTFLGVFRTVRFSCPISKCCPRFLSQSRHCSFPLGRRVSRNKNRVGRRTTVIDLRTPAGWEEGNAEVQPLFSFRPFSGPSPRTEFHFTVFRVRRQSSIDRNRLRTRRPSRFFPFIFTSLFP